MDAPFLRRVGSLIRRRALEELSVVDTVSARVWLLVVDQATHKQPQCTTHSAISRFGTACQCLAASEMPPSGLPNRRRSWQGYAREGSDTPGRREPTECERGRAECSGPSLHVRPRRSAEVW